MQLRNTESWVNELSTPSFPLFRIMKVQPDCSWKPVGNSQHAFYISEILCDSVCAFTYFQLLALCFL